MSARHAALASFSPGSKQIMNELSSSFRDGRTKGGLSSSLGRMDNTVVSCTIISVLVVCPGNYKSPRVRREDTGKRRAEKVVAELMNK